MTRLLLITLSASAVFGSTLFTTNAPEIIADGRESSSDSNTKRSFSDILQKGDWIWVSPPPARKDSKPDDTYIVHLILTAKKAATLSEAEQGEVRVRADPKMKFNPLYQVSEVGSDFVAYRPAAGLGPIPRLAANFDEIYLRFDRIRLIGANAEGLPDRK